MLGSSGRLAALSARGVFRRGFALALRRAAVFYGGGRAAGWGAGWLFFAYGQGITKKKEGKIAAIQPGAGKNVDWAVTKKGNRSAAPHLRTIGPAYVHEVRSADPLVQICGTAERLQFGGYWCFGDRPGERLRKKYTRQPVMHKANSSQGHGAQGTPPCFSLAALVPGQVRGRAAPAGPVLLNLLTNCVFCCIYLFFPAGFRPESTQRKRIT